MNYLEQFRNNWSNVLNGQASKKERTEQGNHSPLLVNKEMSKVMITRTWLGNKHLKNKDANTLREEIFAKEYLVKVFSHNLFLQFCPEVAKLNFVNFVW